MEPDSPWWPPQPTQATSAPDEETLQPGDNHTLALAEQDRCGAWSVLERILQEGASEPVPDSSTTFSCAELEAGWLPEMDRDHEGAKLDPSLADGLYKGPSRGHVQERFAQLVGMPRGYGYGASMGAWILAIGCAPGGTTPSGGGGGPALGGSADGGAKKYRIAVIPKGTTHEFWKSVHYGAEQAAKELGNVEVLWKGPILERDREGQIQVVQDFIVQRVDGICLAPLDSQALVEYVDEAVEKGVPVVIFDSGLDKEEAKKITKLIKDSKLKVTAQVQDNQVRVTGKKIDDLQAVIALVKQADLGLPLQYVNMRS